MNCDGNTITTINAKSPTGSPTGINNEGLTRQQLNLISQIMQQQQSKQVSGQKTTAQRPRTWNMQVSKNDSKFTVELNNNSLSLSLPQYFVSDAASAQHSKTNPKPRQPQVCSVNQFQQQSIQWTKARTETCRM